MGKDLFAKHGAVFAELGVNPNNGFGDVVGKIGQLPEEKRKEIEADIEACYASRPKLAMVNSNRGITNLHVPSDVIIDASMPAMIRGMDGLGGGMWCPDSAPGAKDSHLMDTKALIPDRCYAGVFKEAVEFCQKHGAFDPTTMGSVPNVGLMAQKAEEYGSHPNTFELKKTGTVRIVVNGSNLVLKGIKANQGDIYRACQTKAAPIKDWVKLAVARCQANDFPNNDKPCKAIFWLDTARDHDVVIKGLVEKYLPEFDPESKCDIEILSPMEAMRVTCQRAKDGLNTISVTGNVLRDYLTDLFPILELNTSSKMLSIVPMLNGGSMYETGAGGSAPKHVQQFTKEGHLRWDSLGEYLALCESFKLLGERTKNDKVTRLGETLSEAVGQLLDNNESPPRKVNEIDNRGSHFHIAKHWAKYQAEYDAEFSGLA